LAFCRGTYTCSSKSTYSVKEDVLSEEQDNDADGSLSEVDDIKGQDDIDELAS